MNIIRTARVEAYEATAGICENTEKLGVYITKLDNTVRLILNDLAATRSKGLDLERTQGAFVSLDEVIRKVMSSEKKASNKTSDLKYRTFGAPPSLKEKLWQIWEKEYPKLVKLWEENKNIKQEKK